MEEEKRTGRDGKTYPAQKAKLCEKCTRLGASPGCPQCEQIRNAKSNARAEKEAARVKAKADKETARKKQQADREAAREKEQADREAAKAEKQAAKEAADAERKAQQEAAREAKQKEKVDATTPSQTPATDKVGHAIPPPIADAFANLERFEQLDGLARQMQKGMDNLSNLPGGEQLRRFLKPTGSEGKTINKSEHLNALKRDLQGTRPHSVCPWCVGKATNGCKGCSGMGWVTATTWKDADDAVKARLK